MRSLFYIVVMAVITEYVCKPVKIDRQTLINEYPILSAELDRRRNLDAK